MFTLVMFVVGVVGIVYSLIYMVGTIYAFIAGVIQAEKELKAERADAAKARRAEWIEKMIKKDERGGDVWRRGRLWGEYGAEYDAMQATQKPSQSH